MQNAINAAAEQDTIILPVCNTSWTQNVRMTKKHVNIIGQGDGQTVITDNVQKNPACSNGLSIIGLPAALTIDDTTYRQGWGQILVPGDYPVTPVRLSSLTFVTGVVATATCFHIFIASGSHQLRIDHLSCTLAQRNDNCIGIDGDVWGLFDHVTSSGAPGTGSSESILVRTQMWQAVGYYGDNSWAQPSTYGTIQQVTIEDTKVIPNGFIWCEYGSRCAVRYTTLSGISSHGTDSLGRYRSARHSEFYHNTFACDPTVTIGGTTGVSGIFGPRGGTSMFWSNNVARNNQTGCSTAVSSLNNVGSYYRAYQRFPVWGTSNVSANYRGACDGTSIFDYNQQVVATGVADAASSKDTLVVNPSPNWTAGQWYGYVIHNVDGAGAPVSAAGTACTSGNFGTITGPWGGFIKSNTANTITTNASPFDCQQGGYNTWTAGDHWEIRQWGKCLDNVGWGAGALIDGGYNGINFTCVAGGTGQTCAPPVANQVCSPISTGVCGWVNEQLDPIYNWDNVITDTNTNLTTPFGFGVQYGETVSPAQKFNQEIYNQNLNFNGSATLNDNNTGGVGTGLLASRPPTCTPQVGWWATDQQILYQCTATNTWSVHYQPLTYPHPFTLISTLSKNGHLIETGDGHVLLHPKFKKPKPHKKPPHESHEK